MLSEIICRQLDGVGVPHPLGHFAKILDQLAVGVDLNRDFVVRIGVRDNKGDVKVLINCPVVVAITANIGSGVVVYFDRIAYPIATCCIVSISRIHAITYGL